jgi:flagellar basal-body rod modification protein FlgD
MVINGTHAVTGTATTGTAGTTGTGTSGTSSSSSTSATGGVNLGGTDFLTLMLAQLKNQDPTSPIDSNQFLTQLAQLSEVQGINQLNTSFSTMASGSQAMQASSLLGHQVLVSSSTATLATAGASVTGAVDVPQTSTQVIVDVSDAGGNLVQQVSLGAQSAGMANFTWDGTEADGSQAPAGTYTLTAQVAGVSSSTAIPTYVNGMVQSVSMGGTSSSGSGSGLTLNVSGLGSVPYSSVLQISN